MNPSTHANATRRQWLATAAGGTVALVGAAAPAATPPQPPDSAVDTLPASPLELVVGARAATTPTGMTVSPTGRIFIFLPRFDDKTVYTVAEVAPDGTTTPYPDAATNRPDPQRPQDTWFSVPNGVIDGAGRLWLLDGGQLSDASPPTPGAPKLVCIDLGSNRVLRVIPLGAAVEPTSSLNDLRVESGRGRGEFAYLTDQGTDGQGALIAVDLVTGGCLRRLARHSSALSQKGVVKLVEGRQVLKRGAGGRVSPVQGGANGIALSADGRRLYYAPLMGRRLYAVDTDVLRDPQASDAAVAATVHDLGEKGLTGGLICDAADRVYLALQEHDAIGRRERDGTITVLVRDPRLVWPDTFWITADGWLYISATQVNRRPEYNAGVDLQRPPYAILRMRIDAGPA